MSNKRNKKLTTEEVRKFIESKGYKLLSEYENSSIKILETFCLAKDVQNVNQKNLANILN